MMWKKNRKEVPAEVEQVETEQATQTEETDTETLNTIVLTSDPETVWNLEEAAHGTFSGNVAEAYSNVEAHAAKFSEELNYYAFDLNHELVKEGEPVNRLALTEHEAWDLSVALVQEMAARKDSEEEPKKIIVVVNDTLELLQKSNPENADQWMQFRGYMETLEAEGANHGIHLLFA